MFEKELNQQYLIEVTQNMLYGIKEEFKKEYDTCSFWELAKEHRMDHAIKHYFGAWSDFKSNYSVDTYVKHDEYLEELKKICRRFNQEKIDYRVVKGIFLSEYVFRDLFYRNVGDIDLVVQEDDFHRAYYVMREMGYSLAGELGDDGPKLTLGVNFCEMKMKKENIFAEVKRGVSAIDTDFKPWFPNYRTVDINGLPVYTLDEFHTVLLMFSQAFINNEGKVVFYKCRLREYFDVAYHIINHPNFDWACLKELADRYELTHQIYAVIRSVDQIYGLPEEVISKIMNLFSLSDLPYKQTFFYYNEDKNEEFNEGLLVQYHKANTRYSIFDKDFSVYQYVKNYKAVLYSKRNRDYCKRTKLNEGQITPWIDYVSNSNELFMKYRYILNKEFLNIEVAVNVEKTVCLATEKVSVRAAWYDNDITSCMLQRHVDSGILVKEIPYEETERAGRVFTRNYYKVGEYADKIKEHENLDKIDISVKRYDDEIYIQFKLPFTLIFDVLDSIAFEVKLVLNHNETQVMSMGSQVDVISV